MNVDGEARTRIGMRLREAARKPDVLALLCLAALVASIVFSLATLTRFPILSGNESWIGSTAWSFLSGHGFRPSLTVGGGPYDNGALDYYLPRIGTAPFIIAQALAGPSFWAYRFAAFVIGLIALAVFVSGVRGRYGTATAAVAGLALSLSWGFFSASHLIRWDSLSFLVTCIVLVVLLHGVPSLRGCILLGALFGLTPDVQGSMLAVVPAVILLLAWERPGRFQRVGRFVTGMAGGMLAVSALHAFPYFRDDGGQWERVYAPTYTNPMKQSLDLMSLSPIWGEHIRYDFMRAGLPGDQLGFKILMIALGASLFVLAVQRPRSSYPTHLVPGLLLISHLAGLALIAPNKGPMTAWYVLPFAIAAIAEALCWISTRLPGSQAVLRRCLPVAALGALSVVQFNALLDTRQLTPKEPIFTQRFQQVARTTVRPGESVMGDYIYWWGFQNVDYHWNSWIWNDRWAHGTTFDEAFNRLCPDVVLYDSVWDSRYAQTTGHGRRFPSLAPTDASEQQAIHALLKREYEAVRTVTIDGRRIEFWRRHPGACSGILTNGRGDT